MTGLHAHCCWQAAIGALRVHYAPIDAIQIDRAQGTEENISSLTDVIRRNPSDPKATMCAGSLRAFRSVPQCSG
jgi:hypothetical protein